MPIFTNPVTRLSPIALTPNLTAGLTATAFASLSKCVRLSAAETRALLEPAGGIRYAIPMAGLTKQNLAFIGSHSDGSTSVNNFSCSCNLWGLTRTANAGGVLSGASMARHLGKLVIKMGSHVGTAAAEDVTNVEYFADTITPTKSDESSSTIKGPATDFETADVEGSNEVYSAAGNDVAEYMLRGFGREEFLIPDFFAPLDASDAATVLLRMNILFQGSNV